MRTVYMIARLTGWMALRRNVSPTIGSMPNGSVPAAWGGRSPTWSQARSVAEAASAIVSGSAFRIQSRKKPPLRPMIPQICGNFLHNIFAASKELSMMAGIGATAPRLHGFHRFLPRLWELFFRRVFRRSRRLIPVPLPICRSADSTPLPPLGPGLVDFNGELDLKKRPFLPHLRLWHWPAKSE
jgi:hypothetical protein